ncbi:MAG: hypothetical protein ACTHU0_23085 [Kofleriaceae bacterium]
MRPALLAAVLGGALAAPSAARADRAEEALARSTVVYARGASLWKSDARGRNETELVALPIKAPVRALRTDANGAVLLVDLGGKWFWMPLDGSAKALVELPCADGPAQLATDGRCVLCRSAEKPEQSIIHNLASSRSTQVAIPAPGARLVGSYTTQVNDRRLVWADKSGVWSAPPADPGNRTQVAPEPPLRGLLPSPDGKRAVGVYASAVYEGRKTTKPAELLMGFSLDGSGGRRKGIRNGVPVEWSHDSKWVLIQDGSAACIMQATGGEYKCWRGYTAASIAPDGSYALLLGDRDKADRKDAKSDKKKGGRKDDKKGKEAAKKPPEPTAEPEGEPELASDEGGEPVDDVAIAPPSGPLALYRAQLNGAFTTAPSLVAKVVDGAAVWIPGPR